MSDAATFAPQSIEKIGDLKLRIVWGDGHETTFGFADLRRACPCAVCRDDWTGERLLDPSSVPADLAARKADLVGRYALSFDFADGHGSGIYSFELLRSLCGCRDCAKGRA
jgi:DUF971 family protein